jgi:Ribonucleotide reductase, small chain
MYAALLFLSLATFLPCSETKHGALLESRGGAIATWHKQTKSKRRAIELDESKGPRNVIASSSFSGLLCEPSDEQKEKRFSDEEVSTRIGMETNRRNSVTFPDRISELRAHSLMHVTGRLRPAEIRKSDCKSLAKRPDISDPILAPDLSRFSLFPIENKRAWEMYKMHVASFWTTEEVDLGMDIYDWQNKLNDDERYFIEMILAFFAGKPFCDTRIGNEKFLTPLT